MKKILLATTMIVGGASIAAADVTLSGSARMGVIKNFNDGFAGNGVESDLSFTSRARVEFKMAGESDSGLQFGASFRADNAAAANLGDGGSVFISGAFGELSMGDVDGAAQMATGHVAGVGLTGLTDLNESTFLGAGDGATDPTALYKYQTGSFTVFLSATNPRPVLGTAPAAATAHTPATTGTRTSDTQAIAIGAKYTFGDYAIGLGYEKVTGFAAPAVGVSAVGTASNVDVDHIVLKVSGTISGFNVQGLVGQADGNTGAARLNNAKQYAMSVGYTSGPITGTVFYTDDSALGGATAFGLGGAYDLGGGASVVGGFAREVNGADSSTADLGVSFKF